MPKLTKRFVDTLSPDLADKGDIIVWDDSVKGLGIRIKKSGVMSWLIQYRNAEGRSRRLTLDKVGILTPDDARKMALDKLRAVAGGADPVADRNKLRQGTTVEELCDVYLKRCKARLWKPGTEWKRGMMKPSTLKMDESRIRCHIVPLLGNRKVASLTPGDIEQFQIDIASGKTAKKREKKGGKSGLQTGGYGVAGRTVGQLHTILEIARQNTIIVTNPAGDVKKFEAKKRERFLNEAEYKALGAAMRAGLADKSESAVAIAALRALILTGCRKNEILRLTWKEFDEAESCLRLVDSKTGPQVRVIGAAAVRHIAAQPKLNERDERAAWVFPGISGNSGHFVGAPRVLERLCAKAKPAIENVSLHTLRHSFASMGGLLGFSEIIVGAALGQSSGTVTGRYMHFADRTLVSVVDQIAGHIDALLEGKKTGQAAEKVVTLPQKRRGGKK